MVGRQSGGTGEIGQKRGRAKCFVMGASARLVWSVQGEILMGGRCWTLLATGGPEGPGFVQAARTRGRCCRRGWAWTLSNRGDESGSSLAADRMNGMERGELWTVQIRTSRKATALLESGGAFLPCRQKKARQAKPGGAPAAGIRVPELVSAGLSFRAVAVPELGVRLVALGFGLGSFGLCHFLLQPLASSRSSYPGRYVGLHATLYPFFLSCRIRSSRSVLRLLREPCLSTLKVARPSTSSCHMLWYLF
jgi:hypothetical protein